MSSDRQCVEDLAKLLAQLPPPMREALQDQGHEFAEELAKDYLAADPQTREDMAAFFESDGPRHVHEAKLKLDDATPTSADLARW